MSYQQVCDRSMNADKFKLVSKPKQDDLGTKTMAAYLLSGGKTNKNVL